MDRQLIMEEICKSRIELPDQLIGKTTQDVHPRDAMKFFPKRRIWADGWKYVLLSFIPIVPKALLQRIREKIELYLRYADADNPERLQADMKVLRKEVWPTLEKAMSHNLGMALLMLEYGYRSRFLARAVTVGAQAVLLELFHSGRTKSISGEFEYIPYEDAMIEMIVWEPISLCMRERVELVQDGIKEVCNECDHTVEALSCGAGLLPHLRTNDFPQDLALHMTAVDMDERNLENLKLVFDKPISCYYNTAYLMKDIVDYCNDPANANSKEVVDAMGVLSYYRWGGKTKEMIATLLKAVKPGCKLYADVQLMNIHLLRCATGMGWKSNLFPDWTWWTAQIRIRSICHSLGVKVRFVRSRYLTHAAGINFVITKPKRVSHRSSRAA